MKEPRYDDERLAALLAGRLEGPERDELLAHLSTAEDDADVVINAAAILREMEEEDAEAATSGVQASPEPKREVALPSVTKSARGWPRRTPRWAVPAALAGLVALMFLVLPGRTAPGADPVQLASALATAEQGVPEGWGENTPWIRNRGAETGESSPAGAARAGVLFMRLAVSVQARDAAGTADWAQQLVGRFDPSGDALQQIRSSAGAAPDSLEPLLEQARARLEEIYDADPLRLGAWIEAARLAAARQDTAFFARGDTRSMHDRAGKVTRGDEEAQATVERIRDALSAGRTPEWEALRPGLDTLLRQVTS